MLNLNLVNVRGHPIFLSNEVPNLKLVQPMEKNLTLLMFL